MPLDLVETLCTLVSIPSVNPMGRQVSGSEFLEQALTDHLEKLFGQLGLPCERQQVEPQRSNIVARLDGSRDPREGGGLLVFEAHQDTVPVDGMTIPPWSPEVRENRVFGRGACDIKGGMACMLTALSRLAEERDADTPTVVIACSVNEEHGFSGASSLANSWTTGSSSLVPRVPDAVIVAEPTDLNVVVAHKGVARWKCHTRGKASHSSLPQLGDNAIYRMARVLHALEQYAVEVVPTLGSHPLVGQPTLSVGTVSGGISVNTVPDLCTIEIDRRVLPGEDPQQARQHVVDYIAAAVTDGELEHEEPYLITHGLSDANNGPFATELANVARRHGAAAEQTGVPYGTDAPAFDSIGAATVVFGPGSIDQAHTCDEWISVEQLQKATEIYYQFAKQYRG